MSDNSSNQPILQQILDFTWEDLAENRAGRLTRVQREKLLKYTRGIYSCVGASVIIALTLYLCVITLLIPRFTPEPVDFGLCLASMIFIPILCFHWWQYLTDAQKGITKMAKGQINSRQSYGRKSSYLEVEGIRFFMKPSIIDAFENNKNYIVYYTPQLKRVVSAEKIDDQ